MTLLECNALTHGHEISILVIHCQILPASNHVLGEKEKSPPLMCITMMSPLLLT